MNNKYKNKSERLAFVKEIKDSKSKKRFSKKKLFLLVTLALILLTSTILSLLGYRKFEEREEIKNSMTGIGSEIQLGFYREFNLVERVDIVDVSSFKNNCEEFSFECLYEGNQIRAEFLEKVQEQSFSDEDIEVINMISSIDVSIKEGFEEYNTLVQEYNSKAEEFPLTLINWIYDDMEVLY